jgi:hypothetical protein
MHNAPSGGNHISGIRTNMERFSVRRKRRERRIGSVCIVAGFAEPRRRRTLLPERGAAAVEAFGCKLWASGMSKWRFRIRRKGPRCRKSGLGLRPIP